MTVAAIIVVGIMMMCVGFLACALLYVALNKNNSVIPY
tara:strand:+ start:404 stop:517 length:114 start_codon:yes stop_codon:yes gene_type:complete